eukprot:1599671-Prymnesium_polylepis.1
MEGSADSHRLLRAMHDRSSGARKAFNLPDNCFMGDYGAAACTLLGWHVDGRGNAIQSPSDNLQMQLLLCQQQLAASQGVVLQKDLLLSGAITQNCLLQHAAESTAAQLLAAQQSAARAENARGELERQAERSAKALAEAQQLLRDGPRRSTRAEQATATPRPCAEHAASAPGHCSCCPVFPPPTSRSPSSPCGDCHDCPDCDMECESEPPTPCVPPASPPAEVVELRLQLEAANVCATDAEALATHAAQQLKAARATLAARERSHDYIDCAALYSQFTTKANGEERVSGEAAERAAQRAVQQAVESLPEDDGQAGVVLDA